MAGTISVGLGGDTPRLGRLSELSRPEPIKSDLPSARGRSGTDCAYVAARPAHHLRNAGRQRAMLSSAARLLGRSSVKVSTDVGTGQQPPPTEHRKNVVPFRKPGYEHGDREDEPA